MCGIIGIVSDKEVATRLLEGLARLEYRGYDSAGIATIHAGAIKKRKAEGKLRNLASLMASEPLNGNTGIGHTRWATHGKPSCENAHPHSTGKAAVVHNGIIENFLELRKELEAEGYKFTTETDTEVIPVLITCYLDKGDDEKTAVKKALGRLSGAFAIGVIFAGNENLLAASRKGSPLAIGYGDGEMFIASDAIALSGLTNRVCYLEDGDCAFITKEGAEIFDSSGAKASRPVTISPGFGAVGKGNFRHFMLKEIHEQPEATAGTLNSFYNNLSGQVELPLNGLDPASVEKISIIACGTSFYAGMVGKYWVEKYAGLQVDSEVASEFRYRDVVFPSSGGLSLFISQSGETADTMAALKFAKERGQKTLSIVNVPQSSMARESYISLQTKAGPEIGVASTKAFTAQLMALACVAIEFGIRRKTLSIQESKKLLMGLVELPSQISGLLADEQRFQQIAEILAAARDIFYIGRGPSYPIALEGALKIKEISYIHAEGFAAGELKHGTIALIDKDTPVIAIAPKDEYFGKIASNIQEVSARGAQVITLSTAEGCEELKSVSRHCITMPSVSALAAPILYSIPVQLLAYHTAVLKGTDVDQPRNLAKSVTVE